MMLRCGMLAGRVMRLRRLGGVVLLLAAAPALSDEEVTVTTELVAEVREALKTPEGKELFRYAPATLLSQGQVVYYTVRIHNPTPVFLADVVVTQRIPANTTYVPGSAAGPGAEISLSTDGGQSFQNPLASDADGASGGENYTHIRWRLRNPLAPGATALARFRAAFQ